MATNIYQISQFYHNFIFMTDSGMIVVSPHMFSVMYSYSESNEQMPIAPGPKLSLILLSSNHTLFSRNAINQ